MCRPVAPLLACACAIACASAPGPRAVAAGRGVRVETDELVASLAEQAPMMREKYMTADGRRQFLSRMIRFELLFTEAIRAGIDRDPHVRLAWKKAVVQRYLQTVFQEESTVPVTAAELQAHAGKHGGELGRARRVRVAAILFREGDGAAQRRAAEEAALRIRTLERADVLAFHAVAHDLSQDPASRASGGDLGFRSLEELSARLGAPAANQVWTAKPLTLVGPAPGPEGTWLIRVVDVEEKESAAEVASSDELREHLAREKRSEAFRVLLERLEREAQVTVDEDELSRIAAPAGSTNPVGGIRGMPEMERP